MKVLHIAENIYGGGAENVFYQTLRSFKRYGSSKFRHFVACKANEDVDILPDLDFNRNRRNMFPDISSVYSFSNYKLLQQYLYQLQPDIIHLQLVGNLSPSILRAVYLYKKKKSGIKVIQTVHTFEHTCSHYAAYDYRKEVRCLDCMADRYKARIFYRLCSRNGAFHSLAKGIASLIFDYFFNKDLIDVYIAPSEFLASLLYKRYKYPDRIQVVKNSIPVIPHLQKDKGSIITYFGRLSEEKNVQLLIEAAPLVLRKNGDARIRIIGDGPCKDDLLKMAEKEGVMDFMEFIPFVSQAELFSLIADAKVFALTSKLYETFSLVIYESIMADLLPVVPAHGPMREGVEWLKCGLLYESENANDLAEKICTSLDSYDSFIPAIQRAKSKIRNELSYQNYIEELSGIYQK